MRTTLTFSLSLRTSRGKRECGTTAHKSGAGANTIQSATFYFPGFPYWYAASLVWKCAAFWNKFPHSSDSSESQRGTLRRKMLFRKPNFPDA